MIWHHAVTENARPMAFKGVVDHPLESRKVFSSIE
jgi:hypothetical protein